ncbi:hypothetical protein [Prauserella flavalba]|uniref:Outer membrane channel protein CpnT-like N-terminal domain-containing protein n=1 Tax=Prauserella flavalba TaxID=1477506 RepID=A0A318LDP8_9PSEU|nr:hypothetical protein [Prauserella flavalba]PXY23959.1 hypothetical protein BA062_27190 [Prauserella flavalba]
MAEEAGDAGGAPPPPAEEPAPAEPAPAEQPPAEQPPAEQPPAEEPPAEQPAAEEPPAEQPPAEEIPAEEPPAASPPAEAGPGEPAPRDGEAPAPAEPATDEQDRPAPQDGSQPSGDELKDRVLAEAPLPETDPRALLAAADGLKQTGTQGQQAADEALKVAHAAEPDWRGQPGQQFGEQATAEAERTRAVGEEMTKLGDGLAQGAETVDALKEGRLAEIEDGRPIFDLGKTMPPGEAAFAEERVVRDLVARGQAMTEQAKEQVRGAFDGWTVSPVQHERPPQETPHRLDLELGDKKFGRNPEKLFGANKTDSQIDRSRLSDGQLERNYDAVRDASFKVDSGMHNLEIAGKDMPAKFEAEVTGWHSTGLPQDGSLYTEWLDTPTPQAGRFEGKAAWGAGGSVATRTDVGDASARIRAEALAGGEAEASLDVGGRFVGAEAGAFAGVKANVGGFADYGGFGAGGKAEARAGIGLEGGFTAGKQGDKWVIGGKVGAALGIGGKLEGQLVIDPQKATQTLKDLGSAIAEGFRSPGPVSPYANYF